MVAPPTLARPAFLVDIYWDSDCLGANALAVVDVLRAINQLASMRTRGQAVARWRWRVAAQDAVSLPTAGDRLTMSANEDQAADAMVLPGWLAATGPRLEQHCRRWSQMAALAQGLARCPRVLACFASAGVFAVAGRLDGRELALPWIYAPTVTRIAGARISWLREAAWHHDRGLWTTSDMPSTWPAWLDLLAHSPLQDWAHAVRPALCLDVRRQSAGSVASPTPDGGLTAAGAVELAQRWLQAHFQERYDLQRLAQAARTSSRTLLRWFDRVHGQSPQDYLHALRVAHAQNLLQTTYLSVEAIALQCGYSDTGSLRKVFVRHCGMLPAQYRQRHALRTARKLWDATSPPGSSGAF